MSHCWRCYIREYAKHVSSSSSPWGLVPSWPISLLVCQHLSFQKVVFCLAQSKHSHLLLLTLICFCKYLSFTSLLISSFLFHSIVEYSSHWKQQIKPVIFYNIISFFLCKSHLTGVLCTIPSSPMFSSSSRFHVSIGFLIPLFQTAVVFLFFGHPSAGVCTICENHFKICLLIWLLSFTCNSSNFFVAHSFWFWDSGTSELSRQLTTINFHTIILCVLETSG